MKPKPRKKQINPTIEGWLDALLEREAQKRSVSRATLASLWLFEYAREKFPECMPA